MLSGIVFNFFFQSEQDVSVDNFPTIWRFDHPRALIYVMFVFIRSKVIVI